MVTADSLGAVFYLARDGDRTIALAAERDRKLFCYIPNFQVFIYNKPLSVDFLIDRIKQYEPIDARAAARIIQEGKIGKIDDRADSTLLEWSVTERLRLLPGDVFGTAPAGIICQPPG